MPPMDPSMMGGAPPMGAAPMGAPPGPPPPPPGKEPILGPLKGVGDLLRDAGIEQLIASNPDEDEEGLALKIWTQYGGEPDGEVDPTKVGERKAGEPPPPPDAVDAELKDTDQERWRRLPDGKTIADITSLGDLAEIMRSVIFGAIKKLKTPPAPPGGMPGMPPPMASIGLRMIRLAIQMADVSPDLADRLRAASTVSGMRRRS